MGWGLHYTTHPSTHGAYEKTAAAGNEESAPFWTAEVTADLFTMKQREHLQCTFSPVPTWAAEAAMKGIKAHLSESDAAAAAINTGIHRYRPDLIRWPQTARHMRYISTKFLLSDVVRLFGQWADIQVIVLFKVYVVWHVPITRPIYYSRTSWLCMCQTQ